MDSLIVDLDKVLDDFEAEGKYDMVKESRGTCTRFQMLQVRQNHKINKLMF